VKSLINSVGYGQNTAERFWFYSGITPEAEFYRLLSLETDAKIAIVPGFWSLLEHKYLLLCDDHLEEEIPSLMVSALKTSWIMSTDIVHVAQALYTTLGYVESERSDKDILTSKLHWMMWSKLGKWVPVLKYQKDYLFVKYADLVIREFPELPCEIPNPGKILFGSFDRYLRKQLRGGNLIALNSILQGLKKGMLPVDTDTVVASAQKHAFTLSNVKKTDDDVLDQIWRTSREVFGDIHLEDVKVKPYESMSSHSCYENPRSKMGFNGHFKKELYGRKNLFTTAVIFHGTKNHSFGTDLVGWEEIHYLSGGHKLVELRAPSDLISDNFGELLIRTLEASAPRPVKVKFILEPLKVRTISCNSFDTASCLIPLQRLLWKRLQRFKIFELTGTPDCEAILQRVVAGVWAHKDVIVDGDYSAATDNSHLDCTLTAAEACIRSKALLRIVRLALGPQRIEYYGDTWSCLDGIETDENYRELMKIWLPENFWQTNGQLMGSPLSFPFLCLINAAIFRYAYEQYYGVRVRLDDLPLLINGDDIIFRAVEDFYPFWREQIQRVGYKPSIGKNFVSRSFANINSAYYTVETVNNFHYVNKKVPFVNMGLIMGRGKGDSDAEIGFTGKIAKFLSYKQSGQNQIKDLESTLPEDIAGRCYELWKQERMDLICNEFPCGFVAGGLATESGPQTWYQAKYSNYLCDVETKRFHSSLQGSPDCPQMGAFWKMFDFRPSQVEVEADLKRAKWKTHNRSPKRCRAWPLPETNFESSFKVATWNADWGNLRTQVREIPFVC
jgi:hypothetical protein